MLVSPARFCSIEKPRCTDGHDLNIAAVICDRIARCTHRPAAGHAPHNQELYLARIRYEGESLLLVVPVTPAQVRMLRDTELTMLERLALLKLTVPNVDSDLRASA